MADKAFFLTEKIISKLSVFYVTINTHEGASKLASILLEKKLIACCNIIGNTQNPITSIYTWKDKVENDSEILMMIKSRTELLPEIVQTVKENHPYDVPEVIALPILGGNPSYLQWVLDNTKEPEKSEINK